MGIHIIVCFTHKTFGIGKDNAIPWNIKEDRMHFRRMTVGKTVVMGRKTFESVGSTPFKDRKNIILTRKEDIYSPSIHYGENVCTMNELELDMYMNLKKAENDIFVIGGRDLYEKYLGIADSVYVTIIDKEYDCDVFFPIEYMQLYTIETYSELYTSEEEKCTFRYITYKPTERNRNEHQEYQYLSLLNKIMMQNDLRPDRTGVRTKSIFGHQMRFDITRSIPLMTTKFVPWKLVIKELIWFLKGQTDSKLLEKQGVNIWKANSTRDFLDSRGLTDYKEGDIGPMYGFNWRHYNANYKGCNVDYTGLGHDQITELLHGLRTDPYSRRHLLTTYNPIVVKKSVLAPCHGIVVQFFVNDDVYHNESRKYLSCQMYQRSSDTALGLVINIASYAILTHIIAKLCDMIPKDLIITTGDTHIYANHFEGVAQQIGRCPLPFPCLHIHDGVKEKDIDDICIDDFEVIGYVHHPHIKLPMAV